MLRLRCPTPRYAHRPRRNNHFKQYPPPPPLSPSFPSHILTTNQTVKAYLTPSPSNSPSPNAILILTDVYGYTFPNTRLIADAFASLGYFTVIPDLFRGSEVPFPPPSDFNLQEYIKNTMPRVDSVDPIIEQTIRWLKGEKGVKKVGAVGYCFGGKYVCRWLKGEGGVDAGYVAHPSFVDREEVEGVTGALSVAAARKSSVPTKSSSYTCTIFRQGQC